jgi:PAS domain S-box-containing protein
MSLPPLRSKIRKSFSALTVLYAALGVFMMISVFLAIGTTPKALHMNYDSIDWAIRMQEAWDGLKNPAQYPAKPPKEWIEQFDRNIKAEEGNITEPGEADLAKRIKTLWDKNRGDTAHLSDASSAEMHKLLRELIDVNERGMFRLAEENTSFGRWVFAGSVGFFIITLVLSVLLGDGLANRLARPLKDIAENLRQSASVDAKLRLPAPTSLEMRILTHELTSLWDRLTVFKKLNVEALAAQTERLSTVLASVDDAILVLDNENNVLHSSDGMLKLLGLSASEAVGHPWLDLSSMNENYRKLRDLLQPEMEGDNTVELSTAGRTNIYAGRCREIITNGGKVGVVYLLHDITETRQRERLKSEFIGVLSHELKTPLQSLGTAAELLSSRKAQLGDDTKMLVETINEDIARIRAVANDFMQVGMADQHSLRLKLERLPLSHVVQEWLKPFKVLARDKKVNLEYEQLGADVIWANIDAIKFPWAISNILANAIRVSKPGEKIVVRLNDRVSTEYFQIDIADEGPGIPDEVQRRMFEPYYQAPQGTTGTSAGFLGLGLTIAKEVVEAHEGKIEYFPNKPHGSVFRILLPTAAV